MAIWRIICVIVVLVVAPSLCTEVEAQSNCPMALTSLTPCLSFSIGNSSSATPSSSCCAELANLAQTAPMCLCEVLNIGGAQAVGFVLNRTLPNSLPGACNVRIPDPVSQCGAGVGSSQNPQESDNSYSKGTMLKTISLSQPILLSLLILYSGLFL